MTRGDVLTELLSDGSLTEREALAAAYVLRRLVARAKGSRSTETLPLSPLELRAMRARLTERIKALGAVERALARASQLRPAHFELVGGTT